MRKIIITGGAGFIGSHVVERVAEAYPNSDLVVLDKMTYAADIDNIAHVLKRSQRRLRVGDVSDFDLCRDVTAGADCLINLAAESHVDNSFGNSLRFTHSNTLGTHTLLEACRLNKVGRIIHISTDEVYGEIAEGFHAEGDALDPTNPYSASKAAADMIVNSYVHCFKMPIISVRANNIYGVRQYPEKIIPRFTMQALCGEKLTLHGHGRNRRRYLSALDFADAIIILMQSGVNGQIYNIGSEDEYTNIEIAQMICENVGVSFQEQVLFVEDRPFNDCRYAIDTSKLKALGWTAKRPLHENMAAVVQWYRDNTHRYADQFHISPVLDASSKPASTHLRSVV
jgi:dTDP-glucose 4,6-dehydratase